MFLYLLQNSTLIDSGLDKTIKNTKILLYGGISYIILHATLFIGGKDALFYNLKTYFWLFVILDISLFILNNKEIAMNIHNYVSSVLNKQNKSSIKNNKCIKEAKKVKFLEDTGYTSDSDSDIGTDIDFEEFKQSLSL